MGFSRLLLSLSCIWDTAASNGLGFPGLSVAVYITAFLVAHFCDTRICGFPTLECTNTVSRGKKTSKSDSRSQIFKSYNKKWVLAVLRSKTGQNLIKTRENSPGGTLPLPLASCVQGINYRPETKCHPFMWLLELFRDVHTPNFYQLLLLPPMHKNTFSINVCQWLWWESSLHWERKIMFALFLAACYVWVRVRTMHDILNFRPNFKG